MKLKPNKTLVLLVAVALLVTGIFSGCNGQEAVPATPVEPAAEEGVPTTPVAPTVEEAVPTTPVEPAIVETNVPSETTETVSQKKIIETIVDLAGREVAIPDEVTKIVSLWPEATRAVYALGVANRLVGLDDSSITCPVLTRAFPEIEDIPNMGSATKGTVSTETIAQLQPDIIFMRTDDPEMADRIQESLGVPVVCIRMTPPSPDSFSYVKYDFISIIGDCVGREERAAEVCQYLEDKMAEITSVTSEIPDEDKPQAYQSFAYDLLRSKGWDDMIDLAGGTSVAGGVTDQAWYTVSMEDILNWDPDVIILHGFGNFNPEDLANDTQWQYIKAVQNGEVYKVTFGWSGKDPGGFLINVMQCAKVFHPQAFTFNLKDTANEIFKEVYGVDGLYDKLVEDYNISDFDGD